MMLSVRINQFLKELQGGRLYEKEEGVNGLIYKRVSFRPSIRG